jgi:PIN domain nuclease of toxin-antitoxin system
VRLLLDTHALIWWLVADDALSSTARRAIADPANDVFVSAASAWEIATKHRIGKLPQAALLAADVAGFVAAQGFNELPVSIRHGQIAGQPAADPQRSVRSHVGRPSGSWGYDPRFQ